MSYPVERYFKNLQQQYQDAEQIASPAPSQRPQAIPGLIIDYISRTDIGDCLKVIPLSPLSITDAGELTFTNGSNVLPSNAGTAYYLKVYPIDVQPSEVRGSYSVGQVIIMYPYWGNAKSNVIGSWICIASGSLPTGILQFQVFTMVSDNQAGWDYPRAHPISSDL